MLRKFVQDEAGIALGLAVIMILLIGVMGAGLLVFVRNDLEAVIEVNNGQKALDIADSGVQVARQQILGDKAPDHYDTDDSTDCDSTKAAPDRIGESWAPVDDDSDGTVGVDRNFAGGNFDVTIQWLNQDTAADVSCIAPETTSTPEEGVEYFRVISTGTYGDAIRRVEAIYDTYNLDVPRAYYTPGRIILNGSKVCIDSVSLFSGHDSIDGKDAIDVGQSQGGCDNGLKITGPDLAYGDWSEPQSDEFNTTPRTGSLCGTKTCAGFGAVGDIDIVREGLDYDNGTTPTFVADPDAVSPSGQQEDEITFPFDVNEQPDANRLCDEAKKQGNYTSDPTTSGTTNFSSWPENSSKNTVVCYEFTDKNNSHTLRWTVSGNETLSAPYSDCKGPIREGTLVIKNGGFSIKSGSNVALFRGVVVTRGPEELLSSEVGEANLEGNNCLDGFINSTGPITIAGSVTPSSSEVANDRPGFYGVRQWSWRELYQ